MLRSNNLNGNAVGLLVKDGAIVDNPHNSWAEFNADLPDAEIAMFIPGTKHGTREVFEEKVLLIGCEATGAMEAMMGMNARPVLPLNGRLLVAPE